MTRAYNFGAGPAALPTELLETAQQELLDWQAQGMSVLEISHRTPAFQDMLAETEQDLRDLLTIPDDYAVIFLAAPARSQFHMVPMNLLRGKSKADYLDTGIWSNLALKEAQRYCDVNIAASSEAQSYTTIPDRNTWQLSDDAAYVHCCLNETINGLEFLDIPDVGDKLLVSDVTSTILSRPLDVSRFACLYAGAQKNIAPAGMTIVIVRKDLIGKALPITPSIEDYKILADQHSLLYTPAAFPCYLAGLMFKWLKQQGGLAAMGKRNQAKAEKLYGYIDSSDFYSNPVDKAYRSWMNVPFILADDQLDKAFLDGAKQASLLALKGHRYVGGMRASIYNAMPEEGIDALIAYMQDFEKNI